MQIETEQADGRSVVKIVGDLRIGSVADAKPALLAVLATGGVVELDLSEVSECDTAGLQLLLMACAGARVKGKGFSTTGHPLAFRAALDRAGIPIECIEFLPDAPENARGDKARNDGDRG